MHDAFGETVRQPDPNRWRGLAFIAVAQLMVVLDASIVNVALPSAQQDLNISDGSRQWVITAYALAFGGLLLFGGRVADLWGRRRTFVAGLIGFAIASAAGGASVSESMLIGARALQGIFAALLAPAALSLLATTFTDGKERAKAFGIYGAMASGGAPVGMVLGGVLTEYLDWRWTLYVNVGFAVVALLGTMTLVREPPSARNRSGLDVPGLLMATTGLVSLVYGFARAESEGWADAGTLGAFCAAAVLLVAFVVVESKVAYPLLPLRVPVNRNRGGVYLALCLSFTAIFGLFLFLTFYLQEVKALSPLWTGFAFLPIGICMVIGATQIGARLITRIRPRYLTSAGFLAATVGAVALTRMTSGSNYFSLLLPAMSLVGLGTGTAVMTSTALATSSVVSRDTGVASAMITTSQQVGGAAGTALLNTIAASATIAWSQSHDQQEQSLGQRAFTNGAAVHGYTTACWWAAGFLCLAALIAFACISSDALFGQKGHGKEALSARDEVADVPTY